MKKILFAITILLAVRTAQARIYIQIDQPSEKKFPVAVANLIPAGGGSSKDWTRGVAEIIRKDLALTNLFDIIPPEQYPTNDAANSASSATMQFAPWSLIGAQALVIGSYSGGKGNYRVEMHLYDPFLGQNIVSRNYTAKDKDFSVVAHHFGDEIMEALTGERGVFSTKIAYTQAGKRSKEIGVMDMDGLNAGTITREKAIAISPAWSPDGGRIAFSVVQKRGGAEIAVVGSGGGSARYLTSNGNVNVSPCFSPGGALMIASAVSGDTDLYMLGSGGGLGRNMTSSFGIDVNPAWSPDGSQFVFASERGGRLHLFKSSGGGGAERLTFVGSQNDNPSWSPKGDKIVFQSMDGGWDIFIMNTDGSMIQRLTSTGGSESPTWAPNGRFIAFSQGGQVTLMREDGANPTRVGPGGSLQPAWGPAAKQ